ERTARAFGEDDTLRAQVISGLEIGFLLVVLVHTFVVSADADDLAVLNQQFRAGKSGKDGDAGGFHFFAEPLYKFVDGDHVISVVAHGWGRDGKPELALFAEEIDRFL